VAGAVFGEVGGKSSTGVVLEEYVVVLE